MIIIPNNNSSSISKDDIKLSDIKLDVKGIKDLDGRIGYGHNHTSDQVIFPKLDWTDKYILNEIIEELHEDIKQLQNQNGNVNMTLED